MVLRPPGTTQVDDDRAPFDIDATEDGGPPPRRTVRRGAHRAEGWWRRHRARTRERRDRRKATRAARRTWIGRHPKTAGALVVVVALTPVWQSLGSALADPAFGPTVSSRFVEWVRDHGGDGLVRWVENVWYSHHQPPKGGKPPKGAIPPPTDISSNSRYNHAVNRGVAHLPVPSAIQPFTTAVPGEGEWHPAGRLVDGIPAVYEAYMRPDPVHTSTVIGVAWMDTTLLRATQYSGSYVPGGGPWHYTAPVSQADAATLDVAFNSGFRMKDARGGYFAEGKTVVPLQNGAASFVIYDNGTATVGQWGRDVTSTTGVASVRQNLHLLVDGGRPIPGLVPTDTSLWGFTLGNAVFVWRSGVGVTANGALVYVGGPGLNITTLADVLARAGAVRAMELDINTAWVNLSTFAPTPAAPNASPANGSLLITGMSGGPARYFSAWDRDFVTLSVRSPGG